MTDRQHTGAPGNEPAFSLGARHGTPAPMLMARPEPEPAEAEPAAPAPADEPTAHADAAPPPGPMVRMPGMPALPRGRMPAVPTPGKGVTVVALVLLLLAFAGPVLVEEYGTQHDTGYGSMDWNGIDRMDNPDYGFWHHREFEGGGFDAFDGDLRMDEPRVDAAGFETDRYEESNDSYDRWGRWRTSSLYSAAGNAAVATPSVFDNRFAYSTGTSYVEYSYTPQGALYNSPFGAYNTLTRGYRNPYANQLYSRFGMPLVPDFAGAALAVGNRHSRQFQERMLAGRVSTSDKKAFGAWFAEGYRRGCQWIFSATNEIHIDGFDYTFADCVSAQSAAFLDKQPATGESARESGYRTGYRAACDALFGMTQEGEIDVGMERPLRHATCDGRATSTLPRG